MGNFVVPCTLSKISIDKNQSCALLLLQNDEICAVIEGEYDGAGCLIPYEKQNISKYIQKHFEQDLATFCENLPEQNKIDYCFVNLELWEFLSSSQFKNKLLNTEKVDFCESYLKSFGIHSVCFHIERDIMWQKRPEHHNKMIEQYSGRQELKHIVEWHKQRLAKYSENYINFIADICKNLDQFSDIVENIYTVKHTVELNTGMRIEPLNCDCNFEAHYETHQVILEKICEINKSYIK
jgi:hypothetical protein